MVRIATFVLGLPGLKVEVLCPGRNCCLMLRWVAEGEWVRFVVELGL